MAERSDPCCAWRVELPMVPVRGGCDSPPARVAAGTYAQMVMGTCLDGLADAACSNVAGVAVVVGNTGVPLVAMVVG